MKCEVCKQPMVLDGDVFICHWCEIGVDTKYKSTRKCEHERVVVGIDCERCIDCGMVIIN